MATAHLLTAAASGSSSTSLRHPFRLLSSGPSPHLRFNRTGRRPFRVVRAAETDARDGACLEAWSYPLIRSIRRAKAKAKTPEKAPAASGSSFNQLLGIKGAKQESPTYGALVIFQFQYFLKDPVKYDVKYQASAQPFFVLGLLVTALATSH